jgi:hypothetical protein
LGLYDKALDERLYADKQQFDDIPLDEFKRSRTATNPYEGLGVEARDRLAVVKCRVFISAMHPIRQAKARSCADLRSSWSS